MWRHEKGIRGKELFEPKKTTMKGKHHTEETKRRISEKLKSENNHNYGKTFSDETKRKMSEKAKGRVLINKIHITEIGKCGDACAE